MARQPLKGKSSAPTGRPRPMVPKAGVTRKGRRYGCGGKLKKS